MSYVTMMFIGFTVILLITALLLMREPKKKPQTKNYDYENEIERYEKAMRVEMELMNKENEKDNVKNDRMIPQGDIYKEPPKVSAIILQNEITGNIEGNIKESLRDNIEEDKSFPSEDRDASDDSYSKVKLKRPTVGDKYPGHTKLTVSIASSILKDWEDGLPLSKLTEKYRKYTSVATISRLINHYSPN